jgi:hypothetical protein
MEEGSQMGADTVVATNQVLVQVVPTEPGREIGWGASRVGALADRLGEIREAIHEATQAIAESLSNAPVASGWSMTEMSASFGVSLSAEGGVIVTKATAGTTFEVTVTFRHDDGT